MNDRFKTAFVAAITTLFVGVTLAGFVLVGKLSYDASVLSKKSATDVQTIIQFLNEQIAKSQPSKEQPKK